MHIIVRITNLIQIKWIKIFKREKKKDFSVCGNYKFFKWSNPPLHPLLCRQHPKCLAHHDIFHFDHLPRLVKKISELLILITDKTANKDSIHFPPSCLSLHLLTLLWCHNPSKLFNSKYFNHPTRDNFVVVMAGS